jgi:hypothetical protein
MADEERPQENEVTLLWSLAMMVAFLVFLGGSVAALVWLGGRG